MQKGYDTTYEGRAAVEAGKMASPAAQYPDDKRVKAIAFAKKIIDGESYTPWMELTSKIWPLGYVSQNGCQKVRLYG